MGQVGVGEEQRVGILDLALHFSTWTQKRSESMALLENLEPLILLSIFSTLVKPTLDRWPR